MTVSFWDWLSIKSFCWIIQVINFTPILIQVSNFTLISFSCKLVNNFELMFWKGGTNKYCHNIPTWRFWTTTCVTYCWPVLLFDITIVCIGNFLLYIPILCNFHISLTKYFVSLDTNWTLVNFGVKADFLITPQPWRKIW